MLFPENITRFLAAMQESMVAAAAASNGGDGSGPLVNGINSGGNGSSSVNNVNITGNENSLSVTNNNNNANASSSASSTPNPSQMMQHSNTSSSPTLSLSHQPHHHQPLNFANISSLVQQPLVTSGGSPNHTKSPPPANQPPHSMLGNHHSGSFGSSAANALLKSAKARSAGKNTNFLFYLCTTCKNQLAIAINI